MNSISLTQEFGIRPQETTGDRAQMDPHFAQFLTDVANIEAKIQGLHSKLEEIEEVHSQSQGLVRTADQSAAKRECKAKASEALKQAKEIKDDITALRKSNARSRGRLGTGPGSDTDKQRENLTQNLSSKLREGAKEYATVQQKIDEYDRGVLKRRLKVVTGQDIPDDDVSKIMNSGNSEEVLRAVVAQQGGVVNMETLTDAISAVEERQQGVAEITKQMLELQNLFMEMAVLVEQQGETLVIIEEDVSKAKEYTVQASTDLVKAWQTRLSTRKWQLILLTILIVILAIIALVVYIEVRKSMNAIQ